MRVVVLVRFLSDDGDEVDQSEFDTAFEDITTGEVTIRPEITGEYDEDDDTFVIGNTTINIE